MATFLFLFGCSLVSLAAFTVHFSLGLAVTGVLVCGIALGLALSSAGGS